MMNQSAENKALKRKQFSVQTDVEIDKFIKKRQAQLDINKKPNKSYFLRLLSLDGYETK